MVIESKGRLGNQIGIYASLYAIAKFYHMEPVIVANKSYVSRKFTLVCFMLI